MNFFVQPSDRYQEPNCGSLQAVSLKGTPSCTSTGISPRDVSIVANPWLGGDGNLKSEVEKDRINIGK